MSIFSNLVTGVANKAWVGFVATAAPIVLAKTGLDLGGCSDQFVSWGNTFISAAIAGVIGGGAVYAVPNAPK